MQLYPALRAKLGSWTYYVVKMTARELNESVRYAYEVYEDRTLDEAIQRVLNEKRVLSEIARYLIQQPDHFFAAIVVAALEGNPTFFPVEITDDPRFNIFKDEKRLSSSFGVLRFDGSQKYYALDGQHRLAAIKSLLDRDNELYREAPAGFENEEFSVLVVIPNREDTTESFLQKYRRLFSNLNRYAKPMDLATNIIMDEDDAFAILTRRLISEYPFFKASGKEKESIKIKTDKGKNLKTGDSFFTSIETLYSINRELLNTRLRKNNGWHDGERTEELKEFIRFRPSEEILDSLFDELVLYWDALLDEIDSLHREPSKMRSHDLSVDDSKEDEVEDQEDHLLFWPIGQELLARVFRQMLDRRLSDPMTPNITEVKRVIKGLGNVPWDLHDAPWRYFLLIQDADGNWKMRSEERKEAAELGSLILLWVLGVDEWSEEEVDEYRQKWQSRLVPSQDESYIQETWSSLKSLKAKIARPETK